MWINNDYLQPPVGKIISKTGQLLYLNSCTRSLWHCKVSTQTLQIFHLVINLWQPYVFLWFSFDQRKLFFYSCALKKSYNFGTFCNHTATEGNCWHLNTTSRDDIWRSLQGVKAIKCYTPVPNVTLPPMIVTNILICSNTVCIYTYIPVQIDLQSVFTEVLIDICFEESSIPVICHMTSIYNSSNQILQRIPWDLNIFIQVDGQQIHWQLMMFRQFSYV